MGIIAVSPLLYQKGRSCKVRQARRNDWTHLAVLTVWFGVDGVAGIYQQVNHYGYSLAVSAVLSGAMFVTAEKAFRRAFYLASFAFFIAVLVLNNTFGAHLAVFSVLVLLIVGFLILDKKRSPRTFILLGVFIAVSLLVNFRAVWVNISTFFADIGRVSGDVRGTVTAEEAARAGSARWPLWKETAKMIAEKPLLGHGVEGIAERLTAVGGIDRPHNELLQYAAFFGIPATLCYIGAVAGVFVNALRRLRGASPCTLAALAAAGGYFISSLFGNTMYYTAPLFFLFLGLADMYPKGVTQ